MTLLLEAIVDMFAHEDTSNDEAVTIAYLPAGGSHGSHDYPSTVCDCYYGMVE